MKKGRIISVPKWSARWRTTVLPLLLAAMLAVSACSGANHSSSDKAAGNGEAGSSAPSLGESGDRALAEREPSRTSSNEGKRSYNTTGVEVQAGQLTAGEWDDLAAWERFGNLLNTHEGDSSMKAWSIHPFHRLEVIVSSNGRAVEDAEVQLVDNGQTVWTARTNGDGKAYLFAALFDNGARAQETAYEVKVHYNNESKTISQIDMKGQGALKIDLKNGKERSDNVDIMFVVDTTGSMEDELNYLGAELKDVVARVAKEHANGLNIRLSANFYRDKHDEYVVRPFPFTTKVDDVIGQITAQEARGGGDYPEAVDQALRNAIHEHKWSSDARARLLFLVLDAPPHSDPQIIDEMHRLIGDAASEGIRIIPVASSGVNVDTEYLLRFMAAATGGTYLFLTDDSGIGNSHLEPAVGEYEVKLLNDLLVEVINRYVD